MRRIEAAAFACALFVGVPAAALANCTVTTTPIAFGAYDVFDAVALTSTGQVQYECIAAVLVLRIRVAAGPTASTHTLVSGASTLTYQVFLDPAMQTVWGDETGGTSAYTVNNPPLNTPTTVTMYGRIAPLQNVPVGGYSDTLTLVIDF